MVQHGHDSLGCDEEFAKCEEQIIPEHGHDSVGCDDDKKCEDQIETATKTGLGDVGVGFKSEV